MFSTTSNKYEIFVDNLHYSSNMETVNFMQKDVELIYILFISQADFLF